MKHRTHTPPAKARSNTVPTAASRLLAKLHATTRCTWTATCPKAAVHVQAVDPANPSMKPTESTRTHDPGHENSTEAELSITREELERRKHQRSSTDRFDQPRCPECGSVKVIRKDDRHQKQRKYDEDYRCGNCSSHFDEPVDPDKPEPVTDGGTVQADPPDVDSGDEHDAGDSDAQIDDLTAIIEKNLLKQSIEIVDTVAAESIMRYGRDGLDVTLVDPSNVYMAALHLDSNAFESIGSGRFPAGINHERVIDYLKNSKSSELVELSFDSETRRLAACIDPHERQFALIDPDSIRNEPDITDLDHPNRFEIEADLLQETIDVADLVSDHVEFIGRPAEECIEIDAGGDIDTSTSTLSDELEFADVRENAASLLSMDYVQDAVGVIPSDTTVEIVFGEEFPVSFEWEYADGNGTVQQIIAPRIRSQ